ncbi:MAG: zinc-finger-containing protein [Blastocatellia bacterium]
MYLIQHSLVEMPNEIFFFTNQPMKVSSITKASSKAIDLGKHIDKESQLWRIKAHRIFDQLFEGQNPLMSRTEAYSYLQYLMNLSPEDAHIGRFSIAQCRELIDLLDFKE